jgi:hypothetical protein
MRREEVALVASAVAALSGALRIWQDRDDSIAQPEVIGAGVRAVAAIDTALAELHLLRGRLVREQLASERAAIARFDALMGRNATRRASRAADWSARAAGGGW